MVNTLTRSVTRKGLGEIAEPFRVNYLEVSNVWRFRTWSHGQLRLSNEIEFKTAQNHIEHEGAYLLRWKVFGKELGQIRNYNEAIDKWDYDNFSTLFVATDKRIPNELESIVGTIRVTRTNNAVSQENGYKLGLPLEDFYDLSPIHKMDGAVSQANWFCTKKAYRDNFTGISLVKKIFQYAYETKLDCWVITESIKQFAFYAAA